MFDTDDSPFPGNPDANDPARPLNARQEAFCQFYVRGSTAARVARLAGYGEAGAKNQGYRLLQDDRVRNRLDGLRDALREERDARERDWMDRLAEIGRQALADGALHPAIRAIEAEAPRCPMRERRSARRPTRRRSPIGCAAARPTSGAAWREWKRTTNDDPNDDRGFRWAVE